MKVDLHIHTAYSEDCWVPLEAVIEAVLERSLDGVAVMDHNEIEGALHLAQMTPFPVIVGEEIASQQGEIAGLFLHEWIPPGLSTEETVTRIKEQGGLVYVPHPLARDVPTAIGRQNLESIIDQVDILEVYNARILCQADNVAARDLAREHNIPMGAGSDAHFAREIGRAGVVVDEFGTPEKLLHGLGRGRTYGRRTPYLFSVATCGLWYLDKFRELLQKARPSGSKHDAS